MANIFNLDLITQIEQRLTASAESWANRVYKDFPPISDERDIERPYVVVKWISGGDTRQIKAQIIEGLVQIMVLADSQADAYRDWARLRELFEGWQWQTTDWAQIVCTAEMTIDDSYLVGDGTKRVYQCGDRYRVQMQELI